ncbi:unnamed protein product, partial [Discosporangium mesarthrocarpum]
MGPRRGQGTRIPCPLSLSRMEGGRNAGTRWNADPGPDSIRGGALLYPGPGLDGRRRREGRGAGLRGSGPGAGRNVRLFLELESEQAEHRPQSSQAGGPTGSARPRPEVRRRDRELRSGRHGADGSRLRPVQGGSSLRDLRFDQGLRERWPLFEVPVLRHVRSGRGGNLLDHGHRGRPSDTPWCHHRRLGDGYAARDVDPRGLCPEVAHGRWPTHRDLDARGDHLLHAHTPGEHGQLGAQSGAAERLAGRGRAVGALCVQGRRAERLRLRADGDRYAHRQILHGDRSSGPDHRRALRRLHEAIRTDPGTPRRDREVDPGADETRCDADPGRGGCALCGDHGHAGAVYGSASRRARLREDAASSGGGRGPPLRLGAAHVGERRRDGAPADPRRAHERGARGGARTRFRSARVVADGGSHR